MAVSVFKKAASKIETPKASKPSKETAWLVGSDQNTEVLAEAIVEVNTCQREAKALEARASMFKSMLKTYCEDQWTTYMATTGVSPQTPMKVINRQGQSVTFVVQDRATGYVVKPEVEEALSDILGPGAVEDIVFEQTTFSFDPIVMAAPAIDGSLVQDVVGEALTGLLETLVQEGKITQVQADGLLTANTIKTFKPGLLTRLPDLCGRKVGIFATAVAAVGSAIVRYVKSN